MSQKSLIALVSILALFLGGCPSGEDSEPVAQTTPVPVVKKPTPKPQVSATPFEKPLTAGQPAKSTAVAGLIPQLPPDTRVNQVRKNLGRNDPFAAIPTVPVVIPPSPGAGGTPVTRQVPVLPQLPPTRGNAGGSGGNQPGTTRIAQSPLTTRTARPNVIPSPRAIRPTIKPPASSSKPPIITNRNRPGGILPLPPIATGPLGPRELPQLQEPTLAKTIEVTGVVDAGGVPSAIVKVPNEPARSVREGERLLNGQVLVKRIEVNSGPTPTVVLEQFGQEVAKQVGDKPSGTPGQPGSPTALLNNPTQKS